MERTNFSLRLLPSLLKAAQRIAAQENCSVNQFINVAVAEKIAVLDAAYWEQRMQRARRQPREDVLAAAGNEPPREGDELPRVDQTSRKSGRSRTLKAGGI